MASIAANLTAELRARHRRAQDCKGQGCGPSFLDRHDPSMHFEQAELNLHEKAISFEKVAHAGRYDFPCTIYTFADESQAYVPEPGHGADGMAYTLRRAAKPVKEEPKPISPTSNGKPDAEPEFSLDTARLASVYLKWLKYRYTLFEKCDQDQCVDPGGDGIHYLDSVLQTEHEPADHYNDAIITVREAAVVSEIIDGQTLFVFEDGSQTHIPDIAEMSQTIDNTDPNELSVRYFTFNSDYEDDATVKYDEGAYLVPVPNAESALLEMQQWTSDCWDIKSVRESRHPTPWFSLIHKYKHEGPSDEAVMDIAKRLGFQGNMDSLVILRPGQHPERDRLLSLRPSKLYWAINSIAGERSGKYETWVSIPDSIVYIAGKTDWHHQGLEGDCGCKSVIEYQDEYYPTVYSQFPQQNSVIDDIGNWLSTRDNIGMTGAEKIFWLLVWFGPVLLVVFALTVGS